MDGETEGKNGMGGKGGVSEGERASSRGGVLQGGS